MTLVLWTGADVLLLGQGGKGWATTAAAWLTGRKICPSVPAQFYMTAKFNEGKALCRKRNIVQFVFFKISDSFLNSYMQRKISKKADEVFLYSLSRETYIFIL